MEMRGSHFGLGTFWSMAMLGVSLSTSVGAEPSIASVDGDLVRDARLVISGSGFTEKAAGRPLFWWTADGGDAPSTLGRKGTWDGGFDGDDERQQIVVAPGSEWSYRFDHGASGGAALGYVRWAYGTEKAYMWRKKYDDFSVADDYALYASTSGMSGSFQPGQLVSGTPSGGTAVVDYVNGATVHFVPGAGTWGSTPTGDPPIKNGDTITTPTGTATVTAAYKTFNYKTFRIWPETIDGGFSTAAKGSAIFAAQAWVAGRYDMTIEFVTGTAKGTQLYQEEGVWHHEEMVLKQSSGIDVTDGEFSFGVNGVWARFQNIPTRSSRSSPDYLVRIYQSQVSNGAQRGSWSYYDALYIDDSWHRVLASSSPTWADAKDLEVQIPVSWADNRIEIAARLGALDASSPVYLYVVDSDNRVNAQGFPVLCDKCPIPPEPVSVD